MSMANFNLHELMSFFAVLVRLSILFSVIPFIGDRLVPSQIKVFLALTLSIALFPALKAQGAIQVIEAAKWDGTVGGIASTVAWETVFGLGLGYVARLIFDGVAIGANLVGNFMGFSTASVYDPHQESQTEVIAHIQTTLAMLLFLAVDGHHLMIRTLLESYKIVGIGHIGFNAMLSQKIIQMTGEVFKFGVQMAAPMAIGLFTVNLIFGIMSKAVPQLNILVLSFAVNTLVGFSILFISLWESQDALNSMFGRMGEWLKMTMILSGGGG